jgi:hypothetical protein
MLPAIFPAFYSQESAPPGESQPPPEPVAIPFFAMESFTSPALFLTRYFEIDRDLSQDINGFALRVRIDPGRSPSGTIRQLAEALIVGIKYLLQVDPNQFVEELADLVNNYARSATLIRERTASTYGEGEGRIEQITTPGIYVDSMLGRCTACEDYIESSRYVDVMRQEEERKHLEAENKLLELERRRRDELLKKGKLEPFEPTTPAEPRPK